jgi:hypothetical protein
MLSGYAKYHFAECHYAECHYAECHYAEFHYAECHYAECHYVECHIAECLYAKCRGAGGGGRVIGLIFACSNFVFGPKINEFLQLHLCQIIQQFLQNCSGNFINSFSV